jgi:hypothetical protein
MLFLVDKGDIAHSISFIDSLRTWDFDLSFYTWKNGKLASSPNRYCASSRKENSRSDVWILKTPESYWGSFC